MFKPSGCAGCALEHIGVGFVPLEWVPERYSGLLCVGEAAGAAEAQDSKPFRPYAQSGSLFADALRAVNVSRSELAIANCISCHPPKDWLIGAPWEYRALGQCTSVHLKAIIEQTKPKAILAIGGVAFSQLTNRPKGKAGQLEYLRGYAVPGAGVAEGIPVIGTFHPAMIRRGSAHLIPLLQRDIRRAFQIATGKLKPILDPLTELELKYQTAPTIDEAWRFVNELDETLPLAFDIETPLSTRSDEDERTSFTDRDIKLVQLTQHRGRGIAFPFRDEFVDCVRKALEFRGAKVGFNNWNFDDPVLAANGIDVGDTYDAMTLYHFYNADLPANLQAAAQWCGFQFPWKHYASDDLAWYGVADVDATLCVFETMKGLLEREGLWASYDLYFKQFWPILRDMARRGLPVNDEARLELKRTIEGQALAIDATIKAMVPLEVLTSKQKKGLKRTPKDTTGLREIEVVIEKEEKCTCLKAARAGCVNCGGEGILAAGLVVKRWAAPVEFNPNSSHQVKAFMKFLKHPVPKHAKRTDAVTGEASETTEVKELERLHVKTKHPLYPLLIQKRQLSKVEGTYVDGWAPGRDGRIHTTFTFKPATWQTSSRAPNIQNGLKHGKTPFQKTLAKSFNAMQRAEPGHVMVNFDFKSFHAQTTACEAGLADYLRLAKIDIHSFVTCHYLRLPERVGLLQLPDVEMAAIFKRLKKDEKFKFTRDYKAKRTILGIQFAMFWRKLYQLNPDDFDSEREAKALWELIMVELFPGLKVWQDEMRRLAAEQGFLQNKYGAIRRFYDVQRFDRKSQRWVGGDQAEAAVAFLPASSAFGHVRDVMHRIRARGWDEEYQLVNSIHDSLVFHCPVGSVDRCVADVVGEMSAPSTILKYPIAPEGLSVEAEASVGPDLSQMVEYKG